MDRGDKGISARAVRTDLLAHGEEKEGPKFYQLLKRLEQGGFVESWSQKFDVDGGDVYRTYYRPTKQGAVAWRLTMEFYAVRIKARPDEEDGRLVKRPIEESAETTLECRTRIWIDRTL